MNSAAPWAPSISGMPCAPVRYGTLANLSSPLPAKVLEIVSCPLARMLTANARLSRIGASVFDFLSTQIRNSGGSSDTLEIAFMVSPKGFPALSQVVMTATPVAKQLANWRSAAPSSIGKSFLLLEEGEQALV